MRNLVRRKKGEKENECKAINLVNSMNEYVFLAYFIAMFCSVYLLNLSVRSLITKGDVCRANLK